MTFIGCESSEETDSETTLPNQSNITDQTPTSDIEQETTDEQTPTSNIDQETTQTPVSDNIENSIIEEVTIPSPNPDDPLSCIKGYYEGSSNFDSWFNPSSQKNYTLEVNNRMMENEQLEIIFLVTLNEPNQEEEILCTIYPDFIVSGEEETDPKLLIGYNVNSYGGISSAREISHVIISSECTIDEFKFILDWNIDSTVNPELSQTQEPRSYQELKTVCDFLEPQF